MAGSWHFGPAAASPAEPVSPALPRSGHVATGLTATARPRLTADRGARLCTRGARMAASAGRSSPRPWSAGRVPCTPLAVPACDAGSTFLFPYTWVAAGQGTSLRAGLCTGAGGGSSRPLCSVLSAAWGPAAAGAGEAAASSQVDRRPARGIGKRHFTWWLCDGRVLLAGFIRARGASEMGAGPSSPCRPGGSLVCTKWPRARSEHTQASHGPSAREALSVASPCSQATPAARPLSAIC